MSYSKGELIAHRVKRADESLEEATLLAENEHWNAAVNRLYYACFYAVSALLAEHDLESKTHSGTKTLFNRHFLKEGIIDKEYGKFYANLFDKRQEGDYADLQKFKARDVTPYLSKAAGFITQIKNHITL